MKNNLYLLERGLQPVVAFAFLRLWHIKLPIILIALFMSVNFAKAQDSSVEVQRFIKKDVGGEGEFIKNTIHSGLGYGLGFYGNNNLQMVVQSGGNVGIGIASPTEKLEVFGNIKATGNLYATGNLGIGTSNPIEKLEVEDGRLFVNYAGTAGIHVKNPSTSGHGPAEIYFDRTAAISTQKAAVGMDGSSSRDFFIWVNGADRLNITDAGNVGIGTPIPSAKLEVYNGTLKISNDSYNYKVTPSVEGIDLISNRGIFSFYQSEYAICKGLRGLGSDKTVMLKVSSEGNVGIGTNAPAEKLEVAGNVKVNGTLNVLGDVTNQTVDGIFHGTYIFLGQDGDDYLNNHDGTKTLQQRIHDHSDIVSIYTDEGIVASNFFFRGSNEWADFVFDKNYQLPTLGEVEQFINENHHLEGFPSAYEVANKGFDQLSLNKGLLQKIEELTLYTINQEKEINALRERDAHYQQLESRLTMLEKRLKQLDR